MQNLIRKLQRGRIAEALEVAEELAANLEKRLFAQVRKAQEADRAFLNGGIFNGKEHRALALEATRLNTTIDVMLTAGFAKGRIDAIILSAREQDDKRPEKEDDKSDN